MKQRASFSSGSNIFAAMLCLGLAMPLLGAGCGGGDGGPGADGGGTLPGGGKLTWRDDGVQQNASLASAAMARSTLMDFLQVSGSTSGGKAALAFGIAVTPPIDVGTVQCGGNGQRPFASFSYSPDAEPVYTSCSVTVSTIVITGTPHVTGTFEAVFPKTGGGTKTISDGKFDLPVIVNSI